MKKITFIILCVTVFIASSIPAFAQGRLEL